MGGVYEKEGRGRKCEKVVIWLDRSNEGNGMMKVMDEKKKYKEGKKLFRIDIKYCFY